MVRVLIKSSDEIASIDPQFRGNQEDGNWIPKISFINQNAYVLPSTQSTSWGEWKNVNACTVQGDDERQLRRVKSRDMRLAPKQTNVGI